MPEALDTLVNRRCGCRINSRDREAPDVLGDESPPSCIEAVAADRVVEGDCKRRVRDRKKERSKFRADVRTKAHPIAVAVDYCSGDIQEEARSLADIWEDELWL